MPLPLTRYIEAFTANTTLNHRYHGALVTNRGAVGSVTVTLPAGQKGLAITFQRIAAQTFTVSRAGSDTILDPSGSSQTSITVTGQVQLTHDGTAWVQEAISAASLPDDAVTAAKLADGCIDDTAKIAAGVVATADLAAGAATPPKMAFTGIKSGTCVGVAAAGPTTLTGAAVGDRVIAVFKFGDVSDNLTVSTASAAANTLFEATITVVDQIQQSSASDLSDNKYVVLLAPAAA